MPEKKISEMDTSIFRESLKSESHCLKVNLKRMLCI
jgi:hypothetical protein